LGLIDERLADLRLEPLKARLRAADQRLLEIQDGMRAQDGDIDMKIVAWSHEARRLDAAFARAAPQTLFDRARLRAALARQGTR